MNRKRMIAALKGAAGRWEWDIRTLASAGIIDPNDEGEFNPKELQELRRAIAALENSNVEQT